jgi:hypothetical protein
VSRRPPFVLSSPPLAERSTGVVSFRLLREVMMWLKSTDIRLFWSSF